MIKFFKRRILIFSLHGGRVGSLVGSGAAVGEFVGSGAVGKLKIVNKKKVKKKNPTD